MAEDEKVLAAEENNPAPEEKQQPSKWNNFWRKQMVSLKRKPQRIGFWLYIIACVYYLLALGTFSQAQYNSGYDVEWMGLMVFINVLFSVLCVVLYLYSFPKLKKFDSKTVKQVEFAKGIRLNFNIVMMVLLIVFTVVMIVCNSVYYTRMNEVYMSDYYGAAEMGMEEDYVAIANQIKASLNLSIAHIALVSVSMICACLTYVFGKLFVKVDTSIKVESSSENMGQIDLAEDE